MADADEVELKYIAADARPLEALALLSDLGPARLGAVSVNDEIDRYLDTADGRLARGRWACRLRTRGGRTIVSLKGPARATTGADAALHRRPEREGPAEERLEPAAWPPSPARDLLLGLAEGGSLVERLVLHQQRAERSVLVAGKRVGTLSLDRVEVLKDREPLGRLFVVELELAVPSAADAALVDELSAALVAVDGLSPDPSSKLEHALHLVDGAAAGAPRTPRR